MKFSYFYRKEMISQLKNQTFDVLVIGGGITGAGIAFDAASRGMKTALVEMQDFASGTSSRSTKLVHGGLRYLKQLEVKMVSEVGKERAIVHHNGPHVTKPEWMLLPLHSGGTFGKLSTSFGLRIYDFLAGVKKNERRKMLSIEESLQHEPLLKKKGLKGSGLYVEYRTDDARLTIEVLKSAFDQGAIALNYTKLESFIYENSIVIGGYVKDQISEETYEIRAKEVVNAAGPWVDSIREKDKSKKGKVLKLSKGVHIVIDHSKFPLKQAIYFDTHDGRMVFAIPRNGKAYVGTTDTFYDEDVSCPSITISDQNYLIHAINEMFPTVEITKSDIESSWAGVRPLIFEDGKKPSEISRKDEIWESESGLITIAGGKLTGYRKMAETVVNLLSEKLSKQMNKTYPSCRTKELPISGGDVGGHEDFAIFISQQVEIGIKLGFKKEEALQLVEKYGSNVSFLFEFISDSKKIAESNDLPLPIVVKLLYAIHYEMTVDPVDFFLRRTGELLFDIKMVALYKNKVVSLMADLFQWDEKKKEYYLTKLEKEIKFASVPTEK